jgi:hypothetical protein
LGLQFVDLSEHLRDDGIGKVRAGLTSIDEVQRVML